MTSLTSAIYPFKLSGCHPNPPILAKLKAPARKLEKPGPLACFQWIKSILNFTIISLRFIWYI
jgi:hypothetical protein